MITVTVINYVFLLRNCLYAPFVSVIIDVIWSGLNKKYNPTLCYANKCTLIYTQMLNNTVCAGVWSWPCSAFERILVYILMMGFWLCVMVVTFFSFWRKSWIVSTQQSIISGLWKKQAKKKILINFKTDFNAFYKFL